MFFPSYCATSTFREGKVSNGAEATANMGEPSEREALLTILLEYACKGVL
jgi:hypothetical protein